MLKKNKMQIIASSAVILLLMLAGLGLWGRLPEQVPTHWNMAGEVDGWSSRAFAVFGLPGILLAAHLVCVLATAMDPKGGNISGKILTLVYWICPVVLVVTMGAVYAAALGAELSVSVWVMVLTGVLFILLGNWLPKCQPNYTVGIKLPWTLHSEDNWRRTHRMAGPVWVAGGLLIMVCPFLGKAGVPLLVAVLVLLAVIPAVYSWRLYEKTK